MYRWRSIRVLHVLLAVGLAVIINPVIVFALQTTIGRVFNIDLIGEDYFYPLLLLIILVPTIIFYQLIRRKFGSPRPQPPQR